MIRRGRVLVNGGRAEIGGKVDENDKVCYNGKLVPFQLDFSYILFHKPVGYLCSRRSQGAAPTLYELLPAELAKLKTVGRLDKDSSGLILLTNDGDLAFSMTHPSFKKVKVYEVALDKDLTPLHQQMISDFGVQLEDGVSRLGLVRLSEEGRKDFEVTMSEGRNRQIRRTFAALGYKVVRLHRKQFGRYKLGNLAVGQWRRIEVNEK